MISNSFHLSTKSHSISSVGSLAKVERHNSRGYFSFYYDQSKISDLVGTADSLAADVENAINQTFAENISAYNEKQKRADRKIQGSAFEYFAGNKNLDIACEAIFQIGDKEFWSQFRTDTVVNRNGKQYILKSYPKEIKAVMDDIFKKQISAYENIYDTHGAAIAEKIHAAYASSFDVAQSAELDYPNFKEIYAMGAKAQTEQVGKLDPQAQTRYAAYYDARNTMATIVKLKLRERIAQGQMHIKTVGATAHYDEYSPHAHGVSLCYADGYTTGLSSRVAKSVVLNRWALEVLQERLHEIAEQEIHRHPEIFQDEDLKPKEKGRNFDYTTEQITRQNLAKLDEDIEAAKVAEREAKLRELTARSEANEAEKVAVVANRAALEAEERLADLEERVELIQTFEEYTEEADQIEEKISTFERLLNRLKDAVRIFKQREAQEFINDFKSTMSGIFEWFKAHLARVKEFEIFTDMQEEQRRSPSLSEKIKSAEAKVNQDHRNENTRTEQTK